MWLPTRAQVDSASRHAISIAGTAFAIFGLQAKGVSLDQVKEIIGALGSTVNDIVVLIGVLSPIYALLKATHTASPTSQIQLVNTIANTGGPEQHNAQVAIVNAAASLPSTAKVVNPSLAPNPATSAKVTSQ